MLSANTLCGLLIDNRYQLQKFLGNGAFGSVFSASEIVLGQAVGEVAVKLIQPQSDAHRLSILHEIRSLAGLSHPNLLAYRSAGECALPSGETVIFLATELAQHSLEDFLQKGRPTCAQVQEAARDIALALVYLEAKGVVHRDLKPANVLRVDSVWKLADFGLARAINNLHQTSAAGTLIYMSPEAIDGEVSSCGDIWAFGAMLQEALTGRFPYPPDSQIAFIRSVASQEPFIAPGLPQPFDQIIRNCLIKEAKARWTAKRVLECLENHVRQNLAHLPVAPVPSAMPAATLQTTVLSRQPHEIVVDASGAGTHQTLSEALKDVSPSSRIWIRPGIYRESMTLDKTIEIIGEGGREQIILECGTGNCVKVTAESPVIRGVSLLGTALSMGKKFHAVSIVGGSLTLEDCIISSDSLSCIHVHGAQSSTHIAGCLISRGASDGVLFSSGAFGTLKHCEISQQGRHGIQVKGQNPDNQMPMLFQCSIMQNAGSGLVVSEGGRVALKECEIRNNRKTGVQINTESELHLRQCTVAGNKQQGVSIERSAKGTIENCDLRNNTFGSWNIVSGSGVLRRNNKEG